MTKDPFFIVGCVRSGTSLLRDVLRKHPNLASPEETHFFRWPDPCGTPAQFKILSNNKILKKHREMDGITENAFQKILHKSTSRADLCNQYMRQYILNNKPEATRWFDKTPQNIYGIGMIASQYPEARFVHIVRNPLDVISSLRIGSQVKINKIIGACNYWNEAADIINIFRQAFPHRIYEVKYENFTSDLMAEIKKLLEFIDEEFKEDYFNQIITAPRQHKHNKLFSSGEIELIKKLCSRWANHYGYSLDERL